MQGTQGAVAEMNKSLNKRFWRKWIKLPHFQKWEELQKIDRLSYDHATSWIVNAMSFQEEQTAEQIFKELEKIQLEEQVGFLETNNPITRRYHALKEKYLKPKEK